MSSKPTRCKYAVLCQVCQLIPACLVTNLAKKYGVDKKARTFSPWAHVVTLLYAQLVHALSLHDVCDGLKHHAAKLFAIRGATPPSKNALSHANKNRDAGMAQELFWKTFDHLMGLDAGFGGRGYKALPRRFKRTIRAVDATTIQLVSNCMDWAKHRRKKAAAKLHLSLNLQSFLPDFLVIDPARHHDKTRARTLCASMKAGEIVVFDKAYIDYSFLFELMDRGVFWVTRAKDNMSYHCVKNLIKKPVGNIIFDKIVVLKGSESKKKYPHRLRLVCAMVEIDGKLKEMTFVSNNMDWAPSSICDLYRSRWSIEVFFKEIKQTLQLCDFLGHNQNAVTWQIWTALLLYVLIRFLACKHSWDRGFKRLFCLLRSCVWDAKKIESLIGFCGTAGGNPRIVASPQDAWIPGLEP